MRDTDTLDSPETGMDSVTATLVDTGSRALASDSSGAGDTNTIIGVDTGVDTRSDTFADTANETDSFHDSSSLPPSNSDSSSVQEPTNTDSGVGGDTDTGLDCTGMGWECGAGSNDKGLSLDCNIASVTGCATIGEWCGNHQCHACNTDAHCGPSCVACGQGELSGLPRCDDGKVCVECLDDADCPAEKPACDVENNICVECTNHTHCRTGNNPWVSTIGICTPGKVCTCWRSEDIPDGCISSDECPDGFFCAETVGGKECLRECSIQLSYWEGVACDYRSVTSFGRIVWAPYTTCLALSQFGADCEADSGDAPDHDKCRISDENEDGVCHEQSDGRFACTYPCESDIGPMDNVCPLYPDVLDACEDSGRLCKITN